MVPRLKYPKVDSNQGRIIKDLIQLGFSVRTTSNLGENFPDLVVGKYGINLLVELKTPRGRVTPGQGKFHEEWRGASGFARTTSEVVALFANYVESFFAGKVDLLALRKDLQLTLRAAIEVEVKGGDVRS